MSLESARKFTDQWLPKFHLPTTVIFQRNNDTKKYQNYSNTKSIITSHMSRKFTHRRIAKFALVTTLIFERNNDEKSREPKGTVLLRGKRGTIA